MSSNTRKGAESTASSGAVGRTVRTLAANGPHCESRSASSAGPTLWRCSAKATSSRAREAGRCQPRKATSGSASSAGCAGACWGKSAHRGMRKPAAASTSVAASRSRIGVPRRKASSATREAAGGSEERSSAQSNALKVSSTAASCATANSRVSPGTSVRNANWARGAAVYNSNSHATCVSPMCGIMCKSSLCRALKDWR